MVATWNSSTARWNSTTVTWDGTEVVDPLVGLYVDLYEETYLPPVDVELSAADVAAAAGTAVVAVSLAAADVATGRDSASQAPEGTTDKVGADTAAAVDAATVDSPVVPPPEPDPDPVPPPPAPEPPADAIYPRKRTGYAFHVCDLASGVVFGRIPLVPQGEVVRSMLSVETLGFTVPVDDKRMPASWESTTQPGRSLIVCERLDDHRLLEGWVVTSRTQGSDGVSLQTATLEAFLDRRYVGDHGLNPDWYNVDATTVVFAGLLADAQLDGIGFVTDLEPTGTWDAAAVGMYLAADNQTVLSALTELTEAENGPEAVVEVSWEPDTDRGQVRKTVRARKRLGVKTAAGRCRFYAGPAGTVTSYEDVWDYTSEHGATSVVAGTDTGILSTAETDTALIASGWPKWEARTEHSNVVSAVRLQGFARADLAKMRLGTHAYAFTAHGAVTPRPLADFDVGDDVRLVVEPWKVHPLGLELTARCSSWRLDVGTEQVTPVLVEGDWPAEVPGAPVVVEAPGDPPETTDIGPWGSGVWGDGMWGEVTSGFGSGGFGSGGFGG